MKRKKTGVTAVTVGGEKALKKVGGEAEKRRLAGPGEISARLSGAKKTPRVPHNVTQKIR